MRRRWVTLMTVLGTVLLGVAVNLAASDVQSAWAWVAVALLTMAMIVLEVLSARSRGRVASSGNDIESAIHQLAMAVRAQWGQERWRNADMPLLSVRWRQVLASSMGPRSAVPGTSPAELTVPLEGLTGNLDSIVDVYRRVPSRRLVVLGEAGSGKTVLTQRFALSLLDSLTNSDPVPVIFRLASWNPTSISLRDWLTDQLGQNYPGLAAGPTGGNLAAALIDRERVLPILDGFDEIPTRLRDAAVEGLDRTNLPLLLTSRTHEYLAAVSATQALTTAAVVELAPLDTVEVKRYLTTNRAVGDARWDEVLAHLDRNPDGPLAKVLRTPLAVYLAHLVYADYRTAPSELLDPVRFGDGVTIERHLFDAFIPAVYRNLSPAPGRRWSANQAMMWLAFLARHLEQTGTKELAWWELYRAVPGAVIQVVGLSVGLVGGIAAGFAFGLGVGLSVGLAFGLVSGLVIGLVLRRAATSASPPFPARIRLFGNAGRLARWLGLGVGLGFAGALVTLLRDSPWTAPVGWLAVGTGAGLVGALREAINVPADIGGAGSPLLVLRQDRIIALVQGAMTGLTAILVVGLSGGLTRSLVAGIVFASTCALAGASSTAYYRYAVSRMWLAIRGRLPWILMSFLDDAYRRGTLRQVGAVYQFRHPQSQEHLAIPYDSEDLVGQSIDTTAVEAISELKEWIVDTAFERADVRAVVEKPRIEALKKEIRAEIESNRTKIASTTTAARERFVAAKSRYVEQIGIPVLSAGARGYWFVATVLGGLACAGLLVYAIPLPGDVLLLISSGLVGVAVVLMTIPRLALVAETLQAHVALEEDEPDDESRSDRIAGLGKWLSPMIVWLAGLEGRWLLASRRLASASTASALAIFAVGLLQKWDPNYLASGNLTLIPAAAMGGLAFTLLWIWARPWRARSLALQSEDPAHWPTDQEVSRAASARQDAVQARTEWIKALLENGVLSLVSAKVEVLSRRSYEAILPEASVEKLGDITERAQFVPTSTSAQLNRMLNAMSSGAIGLSGPRGIGKSTMLRMFGDRRFGANSDDLTLVVHAPTNYNSRDFLVHLFTRLCELVLPAEAGKRPVLAMPSGRGTRRRLWWLTISLLGGLLILGAAGWPMVVMAGTWLQDNVRTAAIAVGMVLIVVPLVAIAWSAIRGGRRARRRDTSAEDMARHHLRRLRYLETSTLIRTGALKAPTGVEIGGSTSRLRAEQVRTYPELVNDFRDFLDYLGLRLRSRTDRPGSRIVICIDELDKIATAEEAERFINDIKTVFGIEGCFFLVAVSEDALASFARRALAVRTTFDSAFDNVIQVRRFLLADTRRLLVQRVLRLPEPFVWLCHGLSGGLPRDLNRTVRLMYDIRSTYNTDQLSRIAAELVRQDIETVAHGQMLRVSGHVDPDSSGVLRWLAAVNQIPLDSTQLMRHCQDAPQGNDARPPSGESDTDELLLLTDQFRTYLFYAATLVRCFCEQISSVIVQLEGVVDDSANPMQHLANARMYLSVDPAMAWAEVDAFQACIAVAQVPTSGAKQPQPPSRDGNRASQRRTELPEP